MNSLPSAPKSMGGVLENIFELYALMMQRCWSIALLAAIASAVPTAIFTARGDFQKLDSAVTHDLQKILRGEPSHASSDWLLAFLSRKEFWVIVALLLIVLTVLTVALLIRAGNVIEKRERSNTDALTSALQFAPQAWLILLLYVVATSIGFALFLVPGIIWTISLMFAPVALIDERQSAIKSLLRSRELVRGHWWRVSTIVTVIMIAELIIAALGQPSIETVIQVFTHSETLTASVGTATSTFLCLPLQVACVLVIYRDLKARFKPR